MTIFNALAILAFWLAIAFDALRDSAQDAALISGPKAVQWRWTFDSWHTIIKPVGAAAWVATGIGLCKSPFLWLAYPGAMFMASAIWQILYSQNRYGEPFAVTRIFIFGLKGDRAREWDLETWRRSFWACMVVGVALIIAQPFVF